MNKKQLIFLIICIVVLLASVIGATFAYFSTGVDLNNGSFNSTAVTASKTYQFIATSNETIEMNLPFNEMSEAGVSNDKPKTDNAFIDVSLASPSDDVVTICTYDIVWIWDSEDKYTSPDVELPYTHTDGKEYSYEFSVKVDNEEEKDLSAHTLEGSKLKLKENEMITSKSTVPTEKKHTIEAKIYNLPINQTKLFDKNFKAHITVENLNCETKAGNVHVISYIDDLVALADEVNNDETLKQREVILTRDLDFNTPDSYNGTYDELSPTLTTGSGFTPIGTYDHPFSGEFDGHNHSITGLYINNDIEQARLGLVGMIDSAIIKNIAVEGSINTNITADAGGIVGLTRGDSKLENVTSYVNITSMASDYSIGGITGGNVENGHLTIKDAKNYGNISGAGSGGGIIGGSLAELKIENCANYGIVNAIGSSGGIIGGSTEDLTINNSANYGNITNSYNVGGLIGTDSLQYGIPKITLINSYNEGNIIIDNSKTQEEGNIYIGGLMGISDGELIVNNCYNEGEVKNIKDDYNKEAFELGSGGLIGATYSNGADREKKIENSYNTGVVYGGSRAGGIVGVNSFNSDNLIINNCYNVGDVTATIELGAFQPIAGGIVATDWESKLYILNSYNLGDITATALGGGIVGSSGKENYDGGSVILNSYNTGKVEATAGTASGITNSWSSLVTNNVYNIGEISSNAEPYEIAYSSGTYSLTNSYYRKTTIAGSNVGTTNPMTEAQMKSQTFVDTLNNNISKINLTSINSKLEGFTLCPWKSVEGSYPVLNCP